jgi:hypothetical protein
MAQEHKRPRRRRGRVVGPTRKQVAAAVAKLRRIEGRWQRLRLLLALLEWIEAGRGSGHGCPDERPGEASQARRPHR